MRETVGKSLGGAIVVALLATSSPALAQDESLEELVTEGQTVYLDNCAACHGNVGEGTGDAPPLDGNTNVEAREMIVNQILWGDSDHGMPPFADLLTDREIAAAATYVRNSWKNSYGIVFPRSVELRRP